MANAMLKIFYDINGDNNAKLAQWWLLWLYSEWQKDKEDSNEDDKMQLGW